jgi:uncharacterized membrane protein (UPF0136 family)
MDALSCHRGDGLLAESLSGALRRLRIPSAVATLSGLVLLVAAVAMDQPEVGGTTVAGVAAFVVIVSAGPRPEPRTGWMTPPLLRTAEYGLYVALAALAGTGHAAVYALLAAVAFHHYDIVYRLGLRGVAPPAWVRRLGLGWEGRMLVVAGAAAADLLPVAAWTLAAWCAVLFVPESVAGWVSVARNPGQAVADAHVDEEYE